MKIKQMQRERGFKMVYQCKKDLLLAIYDEDGCLIENERMLIQKGSLWVDDDRQYKLIDGIASIHLDELEESSLGCRWINVTEKILKKHFKRRR